DQTFLYLYFHDAVYCLVCSEQICYLSSFVFSSRRRHTSSYGDWSSDVCSSDLGSPNPAGRRGFADGAHEIDLGDVVVLPELCNEIGRASCRERVQIEVGAGSSRTNRRSVVPNFCRLFVVPPHHRDIHVNSIYCL